MNLRSIILVAFVVGCGSKKVQVAPKDLVDQYRARLEALDAKIKKLATTLPEDAEITPAGQLDPPLVFGRGELGSVKGNTFILRYESLGDPTSGSDIGEIPPAALHFGLYWLKAVPSGDGGSNDSMHQTLEQAANTRYLVVLRNQGEVAPRLLDEKTFKEGSATARLYVYDLVADKLVGAMKIVAKTPDKVEFKYDKSQSKNEEAEKALLESIKADREAKLNKALKGLGDAKWGY
jgi:hypothetical protein